VILSTILAILALLSLVLTLWQWFVARRFSLHQRVGNKSFAPAVTLLKSLKGSDAATEDCLRSWFAQDYAGNIQILFAVASADDPACEVVRKLMLEFPARDTQLIVCGPLSGANAKVSKLAELEKLAKHDVLVISDADVRVPPDFLANAVAPLREDDGRAGSPLPAAFEFVQDGAHPAVAGRPANIGLVNCFYRLANPATLAMQWEAIAINADFWSQVLQSQSLKPLDFALGAAMVTRRKQLEEIGGFKSLADCLADDYQLGNRIARKGHRIVLCPVVVECWDPPMDWRTVWKHQLRWARTIRVCQPVPYFFSILSNVTLWAALWLMAVWPTATFKTWNVISVASVHISLSKTVLPLGTVLAAVFCLARIVIAFDLQRLLTRSSVHAKYAWLAPIKDLLQAALWLCAFAGNRIEWRGQRYVLRSDGTLVKD
jgi:ceramide glucosyltransferase